MELKINNEFRKLIPPLTKDEYEQLEQNILDDGCRDALVVWNGFIVDGHNRYEICTRRGLEYKTTSIEFNDEEEAKDWIDKNQLGRRNLTPDQRSIIVGRRYMREKTKGHGSKTGYQNDTQNIQTADRIAKEYGVSAPTVKRYAKTAEFFDELSEENPELAEKVWSGETSLHDVKKEKRKIEIEEQRKHIADIGKAIDPDARWNIYHGDIRDWKTDKKYDFIITDPPYSKEFLPLWEVLAKRSNEWLKDGGLLIAMSGLLYVDQIYSIMSKYLTYYWTAAYLTPGQSASLRHVNVNQNWKPLLIYKKGEYTGKVFGDVFRSSENSKEYHMWGQSESGMYDIISKICLPGQSILDPFCGAGTTGVAALKHGCLFDGLEILEENVSIAKARLA